MSRRKRSEILTTSERPAAKGGGVVRVSDARIEGLILMVRGEKVILDADLAALYGVATKRLNEQVRRNIDRFPDDFILHLTRDEIANLKSHFATSSPAWGGRRKLPLAFTEHGAIMAAGVLNSPRAVQASVYVVRAFVRLRRLLAQNTELAGKFAELESRLDKHDRQIIALVEAIRQLMAPPPETPRKKIGFQSESEP